MTAHETPGTRMGSRVPGQAPAASGAPGAAGRTWTVELPPLELLNANHRLHRMQAAKLTSDIREVAGWRVFAAKIPRLEHAKIVAELRFADNRIRDAANYHPAIKAAVDGVVDAGVLANDDSRHLKGPYAEIGEPDPSLPYATSLTGRDKPVRLARLILRITELPEVP